MKNRFNLPDYCFSENVTEPNKIIIIKYGVVGYYRTEYTGDAMYFNSKIGVTRAVMEAMKAGSMFGWDIDGINPKIYEKLKEC